MCYSRTPELGKHQMFNDVNQATKCIDAVHKKKCNCHQSIKALEQNKKQTNIECSNIEEVQKYRFSLVFL